MIVLSGCVGYVPKRPIIPAGTEVPFAKVMNVTYADDYSGADIVTIAEFVAAGHGSYGCNYSTYNKVVFRCLPPGEKGEKNPLSGEVMPFFVSIDKEKADILFSLKTGDKLKLRGGNFVNEPGRGNPFGSFIIRGGGKNMLHNLSTIVFEATQIEKLTDK